MLSKVKKIFVTSKISSEDLQKVRVSINRRNHNTLSVFTAIAASCLGIVILVAALADIEGITQKLTGYSTGFFLITGIFLCNKFIVPRHIKLLPVLLALFEISLYATGMCLTFVSSPNQLTITLFVLFVMVPQLFIEKPKRVLIISTITAIVFIALYLFTDLKPAEMRMQEFVNMGVFYLLGMILGVYIKRMFFERFFFEYKVNKENNQEKQEQNQYWKSIADIYVSMVQADLNTDTYKLLRTNNYITEALDKGTKGFAKDLSSTMILTTEPDYIDGVLQFIDITTLQARLRGKRTITHEFIGKNFGWCRARFIAVDTKENEVPHNVIFMVENINEQKTKEKHLTTMAETDAMTGLYNRQAGSAKIKGRLYNGHSGMLCLFDVDKFKHVNDTFGHQTGDAVIIAVANTLRKAFRDNDILMRLGGDEFIVFVSDVKTEELGAKVIQRFFDILDKERIEGHEDYRISVSLGATFTTENSVFEELYKQADTCTYESKKITGKSFTFYRGN